MTPTPSPTSQPHPVSRWTPWLGWLLLIPAIVAGVSYIATLSRGAFPGESAWLIVQATGLSPRLYLDRPLWTLAIALLARIPHSDSVFWLNLFSAICGTLAVYLCSRLVAAVIIRTIPVYMHRQRPDTVAMAGLLGGWCAGTFLAFCPPFWVAATRAHPATMHLAGFLAVALLLLNVTRRPTSGRLALLAFVYGLGSVEFVTFVVFAPLAGVFLLLFLWLRDLLQVRRVLLMVAAGLAGGSLIFVAAWLYTRTEGYILRDFDGFWHVVWIFLGDQYRLITRSLPQHGFLLTLTVTAIPWMIGWFTIKRGLGGDRDISFVLLYVVITGLTLMVLFNHPITPWRLLGMGRLLVTPYALSASLFGVLAAAWFLFPVYLTAGAERGWRRGIHRFGGLVPAILALALVAWAPYRNLSVADARPARLVNHFAGRIVRAAAGREWLITDGSLDDHLLIAAHEQRQPLRILNPAAGNSPVYIRYLARQFDSLRLQGLLQAGVQPFLKEWLNATPGIEQQVAIATAPDLWFAADFVVVPHQLVFRGARAGQLPDADALWSDHTAFWDDLLPVLMAYRDDASSPAWSQTAAQFLRHTGLTANNLGVFFEDAGRDDLAWQAYGKARSIDPGNISALLNASMLLQRMAPDAVPESEAETIHTAMGRLEATLGERRFQIRMLSQVHGYVRMPQAFADMGWTWALSGNPGMAVSGLKRALTLSDNIPGARAALAAVYLAQDRDDESEAVYREMLERNPRQQRALVGMARISVMRRQHDLAAEYIDAAEAAGVPRERILFERAILALMQGDTANARSTLEFLTEVQPAATRAWVLLAHIALQDDDAARLDQYTRRLQPLASRDYTVAFLLGEIAQAAGDGVNARRYFEQALLLRPGNTIILELLLHRDLAEARHDLAENHVRKLLTIDPDHAFGNYVLGTLHVRNHLFSLAETAFRKSFAMRRTPYAARDLAEVLVERGLLADAAQAARDAVALAPDSYQTWGTLGHVLLRLRDLPEAVTALEKTLSLRHDDVRANIDMAEALMIEGDTAAALTRITAWLEPDSPATLAQRERLAALQRAIRQSGRTP